MTGAERHTPEFLAWASNQESPAVPHLDLAPNPKLVREGWKRRFISGPDRIDEAVSLYEELGFEVYLDAIEPAELSELCGDCGLATCFAYKTIYTRKLEGQA